MCSLVRRRWLCVVSVTAFVSLVGCLSPTLPLPPPNQPTVTGPNAEGFARLRGSAPAGSWVTAYNRNLGLGYIQDVPKGAYDLEIRARVGDEIAVWYELSGEESLPVEFEIKAPAP